MKCLLVLWVAVVCSFVVSCDGKGTAKNPVTSAGDSTGGSLVVGDSTITPPVEEIPVVPVLRLAFISGQIGKYDIFLWKTDGSIAANLTQNPGQYLGCVWSPDGTSVAFAQDSGLSGGSIYVVDVVGGSKVKLTSQPGSYGSLAWSPDGMRLAFSYQRNIYVMNADGSDMEVLTTGSESGYDASPTWSPDGSRIAFTRAVTLDTTTFQDLITDIYEVKSDGTRLSRLTEESFSGFGSSLSWSPDGGQIIFAINTMMGRNSDQDIYMLNVREGNVTNLTNSPSTNEFDPTWSPDGNQIAYATYGTGIFVVGANGSGAVAVSHGSDLFPKWSSDGQKITYVHYGSALDIYQVDVADGSRVNLTEQNSVPTKDIIFFSGFFTWSPK